MPVSTPVGTRVGAILSATETVVYLLGYGVFDGEHEPPFGPLGMPKEAHDDLVSEMKAGGCLPDGYVWMNPRITLDDGRVVWGAQCWWAPEEVVRRKIGDRSIVVVSVDGQKLE